jgi:hypothetical protein
MKTSLHLIILILAAFNVSAEEKKQHRTSSAPFLTPTEAVAKMDIPDGFEVSIFAAEPDLGEPIAFTFDGRGRIWVVENYNYVNRGSHKEKSELSRIQIFEDTNGDGVFDTKKLFTDKITFSSGIAIGFGGVYLGTPPYLVFIPDASWMAGESMTATRPSTALFGDRTAGSTVAMEFSPVHWLANPEPPPRIANISTRESGVFTRSKKNSKSLPAACQIPGASILTILAMALPPAA